MLTVVMVFGLASRVAAGPVVFWFSDPVGPGETVLAIGDGFGDRPTVEVVRLADEAAGNPPAGTFAWPGEAATVDTFQAGHRSLKFLVPGTFKPGVFAYRNTKYKHAAYLLGTGIHNRWSFLPDSAWKGIAPATPAGVEPTPTPVPPPTAVPPTKAPAPTQAPPQPTPVPAAAEGGTSPWVWVVVVAAVVILAAVFFVLRKKRA